MMRYTARLAWIAFLAILSTFFVFIGAAIAFALLNEPGRVQIGENNRSPIYVCASLAHTDIALPLNDPSVAWQTVLPGLELPEHFSDLYLAFGWGDLTFFRETPEWSDVRLSVALMALLGQHETALRVMVIRPPLQDPECVAIDADNEARRSLAAHVQGTVAMGSRAQREPGSTPYLMYFLARGTYSPFNTCNQWVSNGLAKAGLPHARFAPFSFGVMWPLH